MKNELLFESYPFIIGNTFTFSRLEETDEDALDDIFESTNLAYGALNYIQNSHHAFALKRTIDLGFYKNTSPNALIGIITLSHFDYTLNSLSINIVFKNEDSGVSADALIDLTDYIFNTIDVRRVFAELKSPSDTVKAVFEDAKFIKEGEIRKCYLNSEDEPADIIIYGVLDSDRNEKPEEEEINLDFLKDALKDDNAEPKE